MGLAPGQRPYSSSVRISQPRQELVGVGQHRVSGAELAASICPLQSSRVRGGERYSAWDAEQEQIHSSASQQGWPVLSLPPSLGLLVVDQPAGPAARLRSISLRRRSVPPPGLRPIPSRLLLR